MNARIQREDSIRMSDWSWKQTVAEAILNVVNDRNSTEFQIHDVYAFAEEFSIRFPRNKHINEKIRQILQRLRDDDFLIFKGGGEYELNTAYDELEIESVPLRIKGEMKPETSKAIRNIRLRSTILGAEVKRRYKYLCQVCRTFVQLGRRRRYAETHHLKPLGYPHLGPDVPGNMIVLCPNHHVMFDYGAATIVPETLMILHRTKGVLPPNTSLYLESWHSLRKTYLYYHHYRIFNGT